MYLKAITRKLACKPCLGRLVVLLLLALPAAGLAGYDETDPTGTDLTTSTDGGDLNAEFSYRIVAKRLGFEGKRLEAAPWADHLPARN
jgi:hypothetical protein